MDVASLHLSDEVLELLRSGKINNHLLCEMMTHPRFRQLMADIEIVVDCIADMRIQDMNTVLEVARQKVMKEYAPDEMDVYMRTLEMAQINETDYFSYIIHEDMDEIISAILSRQAGRSICGARGSSSHVRALWVGVISKYGGRYSKSIFSA